MQSVLCYAIHFDAIRDKNYLNAKGNPSTAPYGFTRELRVQIEMVVHAQTQSAPIICIQTNQTLTKPTTTVTLRNLWKNSNFNPHISIDYASRNAFHIYYTYMQRNQRKRKRWNLWIL